MHTVGFSKFILHINQPEINVSDHELLQLSLSTRSSAQLRTVRIAVPAHAVYPRTCGVPLAPQYLSAWT